MRYFLISLLLSLFLTPFIFINPSHAEDCSSQSSGFDGNCTGAATYYQMTMKAFRLRKQNSDEFVTIAVKEQAYDFASANAGDTVGSYLTNGTIPPGVYDAVSPILSKTIDVTGSTSIGGGATCRTGTGDVTDGGSATSEQLDLSTVDGINSGTDASDSYGMNRSQDAQYINPDDNFVLVDSTVSGFPITVTENSRVAFVMTINAGSSVNYTWSSGTCSSSDPGDINVNLSATVN